MTPKYIKEFIYSSTDKLFYEFALKPLVTLATLDNQKSRSFFLMIVATAMDQQAIDVMRVINLQLSLLITGNALRRVTNSNLHIHWEFTK